MLAWGGTLPAVRPCRPVPPERTIAGGLVLIACGVLALAVLVSGTPAAAADPGFRQIRWACGLFVLWNVIAFLGHWSEILLVPQAFQGQQGDMSQRLIMSRFPAWIYYVTQLDHLILVPAFFLLSRGLKALLFKTPKEAQ